MPLKPEAALRKDKTNAAGVDALQHRHFAAIAPVSSKPVESDMRNYEAEAITAGWIKYAPGQSVMPPDDVQEWWYHRDAPDGDWFNTARECVEQGSN